jgi:anti-sigma-K factor RskA
MSIAEDNLPDDGGDDLLAAEFVLGVLSAEDRSAAARRIEAEPGFARLVERWEGHFAPMADAYAPVDPPASVKVTLDHRLFSSATDVSLTRPGLWSSLSFWRGLTAAALAGLVALVLLPYLRGPVAVEAPPAPLVASLGAEGSKVRYLAVYDPAKGILGLNHLSGEKAAGQDFELWMIEGGNQPVSMGVIPAGASAQILVETAMREKLGSGDKLAISLEPSGGSPTGLPTGPVVAIGDLLRI